MLYDENTWNVISKIRITIMIFFIPSFLRILESLFITNENPRPAKILIPTKYMKNNLWKGMKKTKLNK